METSALIVRGQGNALNARELADGVFIRRNKGLHQLSVREKARRPEPVGLFAFDGTFLPEPSF